MASPQSNKLVRHQSSYCFYAWQPWLIFCWICHFMLSILVLFWGGIHNHDTKYIPINVEALKDEYNNSCSKGFVNVFSSSMDDPRALVCCSNNVSGSLGTLEDGVCQPSHWLFFISKRLARFPEAWLLPLFPLFVRLVVQTIQKQNSASISVSIPSHNNSNDIQYRLARRRLYLYVGLIQFRGWILYLLFDKVEEWVVATAGRGCWYETLLHENYSSCQGRGSDFSDHVVLYFAQILPVALVEVLHSFAEPYWNERITSTCSTSSSLLRIPPQIVPTFLIAGVVYLYAVTFMGAYKTAVYFHTWPEILNGYLISLLVQVPMCLVQCTTLLDPIREYFFGYAS
jgi:hypothetical protein